MNFDRQEFWDQKILPWEHAKYSRKSWPDVNASVKARQAAAISYLTKFAAGKRVLEIGCGSGLLLSSLQNIPLQSYEGIDLSPVAISAARDRVRGLNLNFPCAFLAGGLEQIGGQKFDFIFSLGLTDWLSPEETQQLFALSHGKLFFHSFSESKPSLTRFLHRGYVQVLYGYRTKKYRPQYWQREDLLNLLPPEANAYISSPKEMGFGAFVHNLNSSSS